MIQTLTFLPLLMVWLAAPQEGTVKNTTQEASKEQKQDKVEPKTAWELLARDYDKNRDGKITQEEYTRGKDRFAKLDLDEDGVLTEKDARLLSDPKILGKRRQQLMSEMSRKRPKPPQVGQVAPDFDLPMLHVKKPKTVKLSAFKGKQPVALIFGSYT